MCTKPMEKDGKTFACRSCDECLSVHKADWISRAMTEKNMHPYATVVTLTYNDESDKSRDGAAMFRYQDIRDFLKVLRRAIDYKVTSEKLNASPKIRFIVAGEQGSRTGRCHWHMVIFSHVDITKFGKITAPWGVVTEREDIFSKNSTSGRRSWQYWPYGYCLFQEPNQGAMAYVLKYCIKDQFDTEKSKGQDRFVKSEQFASGMFRMSKSPPLGWPYVEEQLNDMRERGYCPPKLVFSIQGAKGFWWPRGQMRKNILSKIGEINDDYHALHGRNLPQWSTLLSNLKDNDSDMEALLNGPEEQEDDEDFEDFGETLRKRNDWKEAELHDRQIRRRCGSYYPCPQCLGVLSPQELRAIGVAEVYDQAEQRHSFQDTEGRSIQERQKDGSCRGGNPHCLLKNTARVRSVFPTQSAGR